MVDVTSDEPGGAGSRGSRLLSVRALGLIGVVAVANAFTFNLPRGWTGLGPDGIWSARNAPPGGAAITTWAAGCTAHRVWEFWLYAQGPGHRWHLWILDIDGVRVVIEGMDYEGTPAEVQAELQATVGSIQIEP